MREIGATLGVSATRVSQLHTQAIERLRRKLGRRAQNGALDV
jgi:DNA-directed RNA polymerase specialized sigma subunit